MKSNDLKKLLLLPIIITVFVGISSGQTAGIQGQVVDEHGEPIIGANVILKGTILGSATNGDGLFEIQKVPPGDFTLVVYFIGYKREEFDLVIGNEEYNVGTIQLEPTPIDTDPIVVTANKYEQRTQDVAVSVSTLSEKDLSYRNSVTVGDALQYISGVNLNSSQVNIRGSSGYSYNVGSRVLMLVDGVPLVTGDTREINFESIPTHLIQRIEVLKGAGSALYGSSALGGVINVITKDIDPQPHLYFKTYGGMYSDPYYDQWKWSDRNRYLNGQQVNYSQKANNIGILIGGARFEDDSYRQNDWRRRYSGNGKMEWEMSPYQQLTLSGNYMWQKRASYIYWKSLQNALQPDPTQIGDVVESKRAYMSGKYHHVIDRNQYFTVQGIWYGNEFKDNTGQSGNRSASNSLNGEIQYNAAAGKHFWTAGISGSASLVDSDIFGDRSASGAAGYLQDEITWDSQLKTTFGGRYDYADVEGLGADSRFNPKFGAVLKPYEGTAMRASFGMGFRAPSLAEAFTTTSIDLITVIPNDDLKSERSVSMEFGINQEIGNWMVVDVSAFHNDFWDLVEPTFLNDDPNSGDIKVQFRNITRAQIRGVEAKIDGRFLGNLLDISTGYTYVDPWDLENDDFLPFRPRHLFYGSGKINLLMFQLGVDYRYISRYDRISEFFKNPLVQFALRDIDERVEAHIVDLRFASGFKLFNQPARISFLVNNLLQYNYVDAIGSIAPIRNFVVTFETGL